MNLWGQQLKNAESVWPPKLVASIGENQKISNLAESWSNTSFVISDFSQSCSFFNLFGHWWMVVTKSYICREGLWGCSCLRLWARCRVWVVQARVLIEPQWWVSFKYCRIKTSLRFISAEYSPNVGLYFDFHLYVAELFFWCDFGLELRDGTLVLRPQTKTNWGDQLWRPDTFCIFKDFGC